MKFHYLLLCLLPLSVLAQKTASREQKAWQALEAKRVTLPNGWSLTPYGRSLPLGDLPLNMAVSPSKKLLAVTNNGYSRHIIQLIDIATEKVLDQAPIQKAWLGLRFSPDGTRLYASGGNDNQVVIFNITGNKLAKADSISLGRPWPNRIWPTGLELDAKGQTLYVTTKDDSSLYVCDIASKKVRSRLKLPAEGYTCLRSPVSEELYISLWGGEKVLIYNPSEQKITGEVAVGSHPNDMLISRNGQYLFTANANENSVSVIDLKARRVLETMVTSLYPDAPAGSTPNALALSADEKKLLVANADNNCLAVFDISRIGRSRSLGFIPTGWYPTMVKVVGKKVLVANGKGFTSKPNPKGPNPTKRRESDTEYIGSLFTGTLSVFEMPNAPTLAAASQLVYRNTPYTKEKEQEAVAGLKNWDASSPIPRRVGDRSPIKYVFYIVKENRTYDQMFGDMPEGNGDPNLCLFPEKVSPNHHALAREFVLLDNFYVDAEVSADGHNWSTAAYATDYVEKIWPMSYGGRGGTYDFEGSRRTAFPKKGFIWDYCQRAGISYRSYGEFLAYSKQKGSPLVGHMAPGFANFDMDIKDITRFEAWKRDFDSLLAVNAVPRFNSLRYSNDHTSGARIGSHTPAACVADNDLALGLFVEHLSKSPIWKECAVFVLEDDAQNGPDHVDAHRSPALVISPYTRRRHVEHTMYSTSGMLRTMELILGLPPMSQYDAAATPMFACFTSTPDFTTYTHRPAQIDLETKNTVWNEPARRSQKFDLRYADALDDNEFSEVIWKAVKGEHSVMPAPRRGAFVRIAKAGDDDDDD